MDTINFYIPNFWEEYKLTKTLILQMREYPECFYDNIQVGAVYGTFPNAIWNGGRANIGEDFGMLNMENTINQLNELGVPIRFTWTNCLLKEEHLNDKMCNYIMSCANNGMNEVIINSKILEEYLREKYPNFKYISSTTKCLLNEDEIIKESEKYYLTVLDYRKNPDIEFLSSLKNKDKYEILINPYCNPECLIRAEHYKNLSKSQLEGSPYIQFCETYNKTLYDILEYPTVITVEDLYSKYYKELGFANFKIEGRTNPPAEILECYVYYMVKPEHKDKMRLKIARVI